MSNHKHVTEDQDEASAYIEKTYEIDVGLLDELIGEISLD